MYIVGQHSVQWSSACDALLFVQFCINIFEFIINSWSSALWLGVKVIIDPYLKERDICKVFSCKGCNLLLLLYFDSRDPTGWLVPNDISVVCVKHFKDDDLSVVEQYNNREGKTYEFIRTGQCYKKVRFPSCFPIYCLIWVTSGQP